MSDKNNNPFNFFPKSLDKAVGNLTDEPTKYLGHTVTSIFKLIFGKLNYWSDQVDFKRQSKYGMNYVEKQITNIPSEDFHDPRLEIAGPLSDSYGWYLLNDDLCKMFSDLLISSCNSNYDEFVHPAFVNFIKNMSTVDAHVLKSLTKHPDYLICVRFNDSDKNFHIPFDKSLLSYGLEQIECALNNLRRLEIVTFPSDSKYILLYTDEKEDKEQSDILNSDEAISILNKVQELRTKPENVFLHSLDFTQLGKNFVKSCIK